MFRNEVRAGRTHVSAGGTRILLVKNTTPLSEGGTKTRRASCVFEDPCCDGLVHSAWPVVEDLVGDPVVAVFLPESGVRCGLALGCHEGLELVVLRI